MKKIKILLTAFICALTAGCFFACNIEGHKHDFVETSRTFTCTEAGVVNYKCLCGETKQENVSAPGHTVNETERVEATCEDDGYVTYVCTCGAEMQATVESLGHDFEEISRTPATCVSPEQVLSFCVRCEEEKEEYVGEELGHVYDENFTAALTVVQPCEREGCDYATLQEEFFENRANFVESISSCVQIDEEFFTLIDTAYYRLQFIIEDVDDYDEEEHAYDENSDLVDVNMDFEYYVGCLYQYYQSLADAENCAYVQKSIDMDDEQAQELYIEISEVKNTTYSQFCSFLQKAYESGLREYFYYGLTEEEIMEVLDSFNVKKSDPEYVTLQQRNDELVMEMEILYSTYTDDGEVMIFANDDILALYEEFVANNNRIAQILGGTNADGEYVYSDGLYYSYEKEFGREYTPDDAVTIYENALEYIVPLYKAYFERYSQVRQNEMPNWTEEQIALLMELTASCFTNVQANATVNDFLQEVSVSYDEETTTFYEVWERMAESGNLLTGEFAAAYSTYLAGVDSPIIFIGDGYSDSGTFIHEFGHYANFYLKGDVAESYDLLETHSQGLEMLYLSYLNNKSQIDGADAVYEYYNLVTMCNYLETIVAQLSIDKFERAVYSNSYDGPGKDVIMADGRITTDEYDALYKYIVKELGLREVYGEMNFWRLCADRFGYCISYSVSLLGSLQLYSADNFEANVEKYASCINYCQDEEKQNYNYKQVLENAGLYSYDDEALFVYLSELLALPNGEGATA